MAAALPSGKFLWLRPVTKRESDAMAAKLFCLFSFILVALMTTGVI